MERLARKAGKGSTHTQDDGARNEADYRAAFETLEPRLLLSGSVLSEAPANVVSMEWSGQVAQVVQDEWIVHFQGQDGALDSLRNSLVVSGFADAEIQGLGGNGFGMIRTAGADYDALSTWADMQGNVYYVEPNFVQVNGAVTTSTASDDPLLYSMWALNNTGQSGGTLDADIDAVEAWDITTGSSNVVIAVIDTGIDYTHPDLADNMWTNPGEVAGDGIDNDGNGYVDDVHGYDFAYRDSSPMDGHSHGTHVAGTIGAVGDNALGVTGINWDVQLMALKFLSDGGSGSTSRAIEAVNYATMMKRDYGVNVVATSNSWGGGGYSTALRDAITAAGQEGIMFVAAAGNDGTNNDTTAFYPSSYDVDNVLAVAASDQNDNLAWFSNYGKTSVDLAAPGVSILSTKPGGGYGNMGGTSMAAPHVAGVVGLLAAYDPNATVAQIKSAILNGADQRSSLVGKTVSGGRLNAFGALVELGATPPQAPDPDPLDPDELIVDNRSFDFHRTGTWYESSAVDEYNGGSLYTYTDGSTATWTANLAGQYEVYTWYSGIKSDGTYHDRDSLADYSIAHAGGTSSVKVDQDTGSGQWVLLGTYEFDGSVGVTLSHDGEDATGGASADAVRFVKTTGDPVPTPPPAADPVDVIVDNSDGGFGRTGQWYESSAVDEYRSSSLYSYADGSTATWTTVLPHAGTYDVYVWYTGIKSDGTYHDRDSLADYTIAHAGGSSIVEVDQDSNSGQWVLLGTYAFDNTARVTLIHDGEDEIGGASADAVRFVTNDGSEPGTPPTDPVDIVVDNRDGGFSRTGQWYESSAIDEYRGSSLYSYADGSTATWTAAMPRAATYDVYVCYSGVKADGTYYDRDSVADYTVVHAGGTSVVEVDQDRNSGQWVLLGTYEFDGLARVTLSHDGEDSVGGANADAVRFVTSGIGGQAADVNTGSSGRTWGLCVIDDSAPRQTTQAVGSTSGNRGGTPIFADTHADVLALAAAQKWRTRWKIAAVGGVGPKTGDSQRLRNAA